MQDWQVLERHQWPDWVVGTVYSDLIALRTAGENGERPIHQGVSCEYRVTLEAKTPGHYEIAQIERCDRRVGPAFF